MGDIPVKLIIQHSGNVIGTPNVDVGRLLIPEIKYKVKEIRITTHKFFHQRISNLDLVTRLRTLYSDSDSDVLDMVGCVEKSNLVNIFVDHHVVPNRGIPHPIYLLTDKEVYELIDEEENENESEESRFTCSENNDSDNDFKDTNEDDDPLKDNELHLLFEEEMKTPNEFGDEDGNPKPKTKYPTFKLEADMDKMYFEVGFQFDNATRFKEVIGEYAIKGFVSIIELCGGFLGTPSVMSVGETLKRRPFFSSPEELFDEEYYDEQSPDKKRRLTPEQVHRLEKSFEEDNKLEPERKTELAQKLGMQPRQVAVWFQNRRARWKTKQLERDFDCLKSSYESLLSDYNSVSKQNEKLKAEMLLRLDLFAIKSNAMIKLRLEELLFIDSDMNLKMCNMNLFSMPILKVVYLTEKLQAEEVAGAPISGQKPDPNPEDVPDFPPLQMNVKSEDRLSTGTSGSAVVDEDVLQLMDSGDSYFLNTDYPPYVVPMDGFQSEEEEAYFHDAFPVVEQDPEEAGEPLGSWVWS
ncbi:hypothetical protein RHSIM_Rhsim10G0023000 [Rhododendron simsii]|uniref:Homeobox-leucine zipper protein n=1 Tax=Rhododendron simsii TaxID=118357 RepID=A0A834LBK7_RHOSS|nr:hypothetical protein RHSIM_Rhsim10G0023000 [Rhododendron simsii]